MTLGRAFAIVLCAAALPIGAADAPKFLLKPVALFNQHLYAGSFSGPRGIFFDRRHKEIWLADSGNGLIGIFSPEGFPLFAFREESGAGQPVRVVVDGDGTALVVSGDRSRIRRYSYRGRFITEVKLPGISGTPSIGALAFDAEGNLYVGENGKGEILIYDRELKLKKRFGRRGAEEGDFASIGGIAVADDGTMFVLDHQALAVQVFDRRGIFLRGWGRHDMGAENVSLPEGIALDSKGHVIVVDALRHEIKFFDRDGKFLDRFGGTGRALGNVTYPADVSVDAEDRVYVVERGGSRVQVFEQIPATP
jgi:DNA-binding beta-propeller fold protein YncE